MVTLGGTIRPDMNVARSERPQAMLTTTLGDPRYIALTTYRRDGRPVTTPVWLAALEGKIYVFTADNTGKAKRVRATGRVRFAPSSMNGRRILGAWREGTGVLFATKCSVAKPWRPCSASTDGSCPWRCWSTGCVGSIVIMWCWS